MQARSLVIFGICYVGIVVAGFVLSIFVLSALGWDAADQQATRKAGFILNLLAFAGAVTAAISRKAHDAYDPIAFRVALVRAMPGLVIGIALLATLVDIGMFVCGAWYFTGEARMPSPYRIAALPVIYGVFACVAIAVLDTKDRGPRQY